MFVFSLSTLLLCLFVNEAEFCTNDGYPFENYLSTLTPYRVVSNKSFDRIEFDDCSPKKIWMLVRHGTRNPSSSVIIKMKDRLPRLKELIIENENLPNDFIKHRDLDLFRKWKTNLDPEDEKKLVHEGEEEMLLLAERMQSRFPELLDNVYSNTTYKFKFTHSQRTKKSAFYFASGLFGRATAKDVYFPEPSKRDPILRFYKLCNKWNKEIKKNPEALLERRLFVNGAEMAEVVKHVNNRLKLSEKVDVDDVTLMYTVCAFETAWNKRSKSPWCSLFTPDDLKVLDYAEDLKYYWQDGYGYEITYKQACPAFQDVMNFLDMKSRFPKVNVYFTHSGTLLKMLAHLGLYGNDEPLTAENFDKNMDRKWRTSLIDSFGTNLAFVLYKCDGEDKILTLHQEKIVRLPSCPDTDLCDIDIINDYYSSSFESCEFNTICNNNDNQ